MEVQIFQLDRVSFMLRPLYPQKNIPPYSLRRGMSESNHFGKEEIFPPVWNRMPVFQGAKNPYDYWAAPVKNAKGVSYSIIDTKGLYE